MEEILTAQEAADFLKMNERTVLKLAAEGKIPAAKIGRRWRFEKNHIIEWLESRMRVMSNHELATLAPPEKSVPVLFGNLSLESINLKLASKVRRDVIKELVDLLALSGTVANKRMVLAAVLEREELASTGIGEGVAFPHPRVPSALLVHRPCVAFGRSERGIDFRAVDGEPTHLFFLVCAPEEKVHLQLLARLNRVMRNSALRRELMEATSADEALRCIHREEERLGLNGA